MLTPKSRRCYQRVMSGLERGGSLRFLTLTSSPDAPQDIQRSWRALYMRMQRRGLITGYIKVPELTQAGKMHYHILFRGSYVSQKLLSKWWSDIHKSPVVDIRTYRPYGGKKRVASYMAKYMAKESAGRYSWSWGWVWRGFVGHWTILKRYVRYCYHGTRTDPMEIVFNLWRYYLHTGNVPDWQDFAARTPAGMW